eukprot:TRINITY_DN2887_c0_g1_i1.p1 TRINITY_DN2887_c0_g1~~TRINITY_DN2887_c0_g1_i1.p1  ORF type:complete len:113 (+),score=13.80 TRINITY_DN2887_c0_g1_i1:224-562(+)
MGEPITTQKFSNKKEHEQLESLHSRISRPGFNFDDVPDLNDPASRDNYQVYMLSREKRAREYFIRCEEYRRLHDKLRVCYMKEGENSLKNCRNLVMEYKRFFKIGEGPNNDM